MSAVLLRAGVELGPLDHLRAKHAREALDLHAHRCSRSTAARVAQARYDASLEIADVIGITARTPWREPQPGFVDYKARLEVSWVNFDRYIPGPHPQFRWWHGCVVVGRACDFTGCTRIASAIGYDEFHPTGRRRLCTRHVELIAEASRAFTHDAELARHVYPSLAMVEALEHAFGVLALGGGSRG